METNLSLQDGDEVSEEASPGIKPAPGSAREEVRAAVEELREEQRTRSSVEALREEQREEHARKSQEIWKVMSFFHAKHGNPHLTHEDLRRDVEEKRLRALEGCFEKVEKRTIPTQGHHIPSEKIPKFSLGAPASDVESGSESESAWESEWDSDAQAAVTSLPRLERMKTGPTDRRVEQRPRRGRARTREEDALRRREQEASRKKVLAAVATDDEISRRHLKQSEKVELRLKPTIERPQPGRHISWSLQVDSAGSSYSSSAAFPLGEVEATGPGKLSTPSSPGNLSPTSRSLNSSFASLSSFGSHMRSQSDKRLKALRDFHMTETDPRKMHQVDAILANRMARGLKSRSESLERTWEKGK